MRTFKFFTDRGFNVKLKTQLIASFLTMSLLVVAVIAILVYNSVLTILRNQSNEMVTRQFYQSEHNILEFRDQIEKIAGVLAINKDIQSFIDRQNAPDAVRVNEVRVVLKSLDTFLNTYPYIDSISLFRPDGEAIYDSLSASWYREDAREEIPFYSSALYEQITQQGHGFLWEGQSNSKLFQLTDQADIYEEPVQYITVFRNVYVLGRISQSAVIAVNIRQSNFESIFKSKGNSSNSVQYLIDTDGIRISQSASGAIGTRAELADHIAPNQTSGSFATSTNGDSKQVTYYNIGNTGWTLINETPEGEFIRNTLALRKLILVAVAIGAICALFLSNYWIYRITRPFNHLVNAMREMEKGNLGVIINETPSTELGIIGRRFNKMSLSIEELIQKNKTIEEDKRRLEIEALQAQINPHFLYNALNTIKWVAMVRKELSIVDSITTLGNMLRSIYKDRTLTVPLQVEVEYIENYLKIMNIRFGEGVRVDIHIPDHLKDCHLIRFIMQPIVENAFIHGMSLRSYRGKIGIIASQEDNNLMITISDNGVGIHAQSLEKLQNHLNAIPSHSSDASLPEGSIGLSNVNRRIKMQYGHDYGLFLESEEGSGTTVRIRVPMIRTAESV